MNLAANAQVATWKVGGDPKTRKSKCIPRPLHPVLNCFHGSPLRVLPPSRTQYKTMTHFSPSRGLFCWISHNVQHRLDMGMGQKWLTPKTGWSKVLNITNFMGPFIPSTPLSTQISGQTQSTVPWSPQAKNILKNLCIYILYYIYIIMYIPNVRTPVLFHRASQIPSGLQLAAPRGHGAKDVQRGVGNQPRIRASKMSWCHRGAVAKISSLDWMIYIYMDHHIATKKNAEKLRIYIYGLR
jgi:hypothetical protein